MPPPTDADDGPVPNPPPLAGDSLPGRELPSPRGALLASLIVWGWGQVASGDRRGWLGPPAQLAAVAGFLVLLASRPPEAAVEPWFLAGCAVLATWAAVAVHAHRRAARRRAALDLPVGSTGGAMLLWLGLPAIVLSTLPWIVGGRAADPGLVLEAYLADWTAGRATAARDRFIGPPAIGDINLAWQAQSAGLRNDLVELAAEHGPDAGIDPDRAFETVRWTDAGPLDHGRGRLVVIEVVRRETVRGQLLGFIPTSSQRLVPIARLGEVRLRPVPAAAGTEVWRIERIDVGGVALISAPVHQSAVSGL
jgi:hypothetical protein